MDTRHWHVISKLAEAFDVKEGVITNFIRCVAARCEGLASRGAMRLGARVRS
jgi:hypothetical protein